MSTAVSSGVARVSAPVWTRRTFWLRQFRYWHWVSSATCLIGMLGFAVTGATLNHAGSIEATPVVTRQTAMIPDDLIATLPTSPTTKNAPLPEAVAAQIARAFSIDVAGRPAEWSADEIYVALPRPGGDAFMTIDRESGHAEYEQTNRGWISYLNDLHKGRNSGRAWSWFIDLFAAGCVIFCVTGFVLLQVHAPQRPETWPLVTVGLVIPLLLALLWIH